jgi:hypothetical protein
VMLHPPQNRNITEWCKREECWSTVLQLPLQLDLPAHSEGNGSGPRNDQPPPTPQETAAIELVRAIPADVWFAAAKWAKDTDSLQGWQRSLAYSLGTLGARARPPSAKQAVQGCRLLAEARRLGFGHELLTADLLQRLGQTATR